MTTSERSQNGAPASSLPLHELRDTRPASQIVADLLASLLKNPAGRCSERNVVTLTYAEAFLRDPLAGNGAVGTELPREALKPCPATEAHKLLEYRGIAAVFRKTNDNPLEYTLIARF